jgi:DNA modification methylase
VGFVGLFFSNKLINMLEIKKEFKELIPPLTVEEFKQLEQNCLAEGIRDKIITWNGFIIDGHNRYEIAQKHGLKFRIEDKEFNTEEQAKDWMDANQLGRRNLTPDQRKILIGRRYNREKNTDRFKGNQYTSGGDQSDHNQKTSERLAKENNTSAPSVRRYGKDAEKFDQIKEKHPELADKIWCGEMTLSDIKKEEKKANFEQKKAEFEKPIEIINTNQIIIHGDSVQVLPTLDKASFDLLLSDPPYGMDFKSGWSDKEKIANDKIEDTIQLFENVLKESVPLLKDDAHFYLFGNLDYMPQIKPIIQKYLNLKNVLIWDRKVIGMGDLKTYGKSFDIVYFGYNKVWKDLNGTRDRDILQFNRVDPSKNIHPTEKPLDLLEYLIKKSSNENDKILEPFAGGGSTLLACKNTNRKATGIEIEQNYYELIKSKI